MHAVGCTREIKRQVRPESRGVVGPGIPLEAKPEVTEEATKDPKAECDHKTLRVIPKAHDSNSSREPVTSFPSKGPAVREALTRA